MEPLIKPSGVACGGADHLRRRTLLKAAGLSGLGWLTPLGTLLGREAEKSDKGRGARSVIILWLAGGPSQLETFDPQPGTMIAGGTQAIDTTVKGVQLAAGLERLAEQMGSMSLIRSVVSKEGDHERASYNMKTGYRPDPTLVHPAIGAVICHSLPVGKTEIPRHVSILPNQWPARGGYLGDRFDAFKMYDPKNPVPDVRMRVTDKRQAQRLKSLDVVEKAFGQGRSAQLDEKRTSHRSTVSKALRMMSSEQLKAFDLTDVPKAERLAYGDTPFGRGCLAARRLIDVGVRCVEVTLGGWDTHINNHQLHVDLVGQLDPAAAALIADLKRREQLDQTVVLIGGEFGRTPKLNPVEGRDHWPHGFSFAVAGGGLRAGAVIGQTDPAGSKKVKDPIQVQDIHATVLASLGVPFKNVINTPVGRPMRLSEGNVIKSLWKG
jgi:hypothetical protein